MPSTHPNPLDGFGPFFAVARLDHSPSSTTDPSTWRLLVDDLHDDTLMTAVIARAAERHAHAYGVSPAAVQTRAMGSVVHLGWCARLVSPWIGHYLLTSHPWVPGPGGDLWWRDDGTTTFPLAVTKGEQEAETTADDGLKDERTASAFATGLTDLLDHLAASALCRSPRIAWGNAASAINGAATTVARHRPDLAASATRLAQTCIATLAGDDVSSGTAGTPSFRRESCCQLYRLPGLSRASVCGDCVLSPMSARERTRTMPG